MTDYQNEKRGDAWAHKHRWYVWLFVPAVIVIYYFFTMALPIIRYGITGILPQ